MITKTRTVYVNEFTGEEYDSANVCRILEEYEKKRLDERTRELLDPKPVQLQLGELIDLFEKCPPDKTVRYDFPHFVPGDLDSYRGYYEQLALEYVDTGEVPTAASLLTKLKAADGATFEGYKGGEFTMDRSTLVWVANYGSSGHTIITGVTWDGYYAIIHTAYQE